MGSDVCNDDVSREIFKYSIVDDPWDATEFQGWSWSRVQESSSFAIWESPGLDDWQRLMHMLSEVDVSRIEHLLINLPNYRAKYGWDLNSENGALPHEADRADYFMVNLDSNVEDLSKWIERSNASRKVSSYQLGTVLLGREFPALKTLRILASDAKAIRDALGGKSLARAIREDRLISLRTLSLPDCTDNEILAALTQSHLPELKSFCISLPNDENFLTVIEIFESGSFKGLEHLELSDIRRADLGEFLTRAIHSGNLPRITSFRLRYSSINNLVDLARSSPKWFSSLESLAFDHCADDASEQVCFLVKAVLEFPESINCLALKVFDLRDNNLGPTGIDALMSLIDSGRLPLLQRLDLSGNKDTSKSLVSIIKRIRTGSLPSLKELIWEKNRIMDADAKAIVKAYYADQSLTTEIRISWLHVSDASLRTKLISYRDRNVRRVALRKNLNVDPSTLLTSDDPSDTLGVDIPLTSAKVFLCGYPEVGKTRLRKTLPRQIRKRTKFVWETRPEIFREPRTRGIELCRVHKGKAMGKSMTLVVWDLAGQHEYHVLHGTFLADLGFEGGKATTFIVVFKAPFEADVKPKLQYWLQFAASSSLKHVKRHVVIVLNCFNGVRCSDGDHRLWTALIRDFANMFGDLLDVHPNPFVIDVRVAASVVQLKEHLFDHAQTLLKDVGMPRICLKLQESLQWWSEREKCNFLPILTWQAFEERWKRNSKASLVSAEVLKSAAAYLHEVGEIIYFEEKVVSEPSSPRRSVVVPNPEWFCRKVVGELLLPKEMLDGGSPVKVAADGSISVVMFQAFFEHLLNEGTCTDDVISMLELVGLCYRKGIENIIVPALIQKDNYQQIKWDRKGSEWVMGRSLTVADTGRNAIPMTLFRRFQVKLALNPDFGGRGDSDYKVGKSFSCFKVGELLVLIQFDVDHSDPTDDRIDILVQSTGRMVKRDPKDLRRTQINCICEAMQQLEDLCVICCPGMAYNIKVIQPSSAANRVDKMSERTLMSLEEIQHLLIKGEKYLSWRYSDGEHMKLKAFLSDNELKEIYLVKDSQTAIEFVSGPTAVSTSSEVSSEMTAEEVGYDECKQVALTLGLVTQVSLLQLEEKTEENSSCLGDPAMQGADVDRILHAIHDAKLDVKQTVHAEVHLARKQMEKGMKEVLSEIRYKHDVLVRSIQAQQSFSIEEKERSVPRYMFLAKKQGGWISLREAFNLTFQTTFYLHLLCEAHFDNGFLHEVAGQEGIKLKKPKEWLVKVSPWLRWSLQVAIIVGKTVGNVYLPGVFNLIPDINLPNGYTMARAIDSAATILLEEEEGLNQARSEGNVCGTASEPVKLKERMIAQEVVKDLIREVGHVEFAKKIRLRKAVLRSRTVQPQASSSAQSEASVLWICDDCYKRYGSRATDLSGT